MPRKDRRPKSISERQGIKCQFIIKSAHDEEEKSRSPGALPPGICVPGTCSVEQIKSYAREFWDGENWTQELAAAVNYVITQESDKEVEQKHLTTAWVLSTKLRADQATPAQIRAFLREVGRSRQTNLGILLMLGHFWEKGITDQEKAEWCAYVESRAALEPTPPTV